MMAPVSDVLAFLPWRKHEACRTEPARPRELRLYLDHKGAVRQRLEQRGLQLADSLVGRADLLFS
jgi:hypothetical protein